MKLSVCVAALLACASLVSCKKFDETSHEGRTEEFQAFLSTNRFQVKAFYSDSPIDYIEDDIEVRSETELFRYVSPWITDDWNVFQPSTGEVSITQNARKISTISADTFNRSYTVGTDAQGTYFDFLNHQYQPLRYRLLDFRDNYFIVYVYWKSSGIRLFTRFEAVPTE